MSKVTIGIDLGGTFAKTAIVSEEGAIVEQNSFPTHADKGPEAVMDVMKSGVEEALDNAGVKKSDVLAVGIGAPGPMNWQSGIVYSPPNLPGWKDVPLASEMEKRLGIKTFVDNDANVACFGEFWGGAGQGVIVVGAGG